MLHIVHGLKRNLKLAISCHLCNLKLKMILKNITVTSTRTIFLTFNDLQYFWLSLIMLLIHLNLMIQVIIIIIINITYIIPCLLFSSSLVFFLFSSSVLSNTAQLPHTSSALGERGREEEGERERGRGREEEGSNCIFSCYLWSSSSLVVSIINYSITSLHCSIIRLHICCYLLRACHVNIERLEINCNLNLWNTSP